MKIGYSRKEHLPDTPVYLSGYPREQKTSQVHIAPVIQALTADVKGNLCCFCVIDTILVSSEMVHMIRKSVSKQTQLNYEDIHICATHTHSAPCIHKMNIPDPPVNEEWKNKTWNQCVEIIVESTKNLKECKCYFSKTKIDGFYGNRNGINNLENKEVYIFSFYEENQLLGKFINMSCHNTVNSTDNVISADLFGGIRQEMETKDCFCMISNGISGDISTRYYRQGTDCKEVDRMSKIIASQLLTVEKGTLISFNNVQKALVGTHAFQDVSLNEDLDTKIEGLEIKKQNHQLEGWDDFMLDSYKMKKSKKEFYHFLESSCIMFDNTIILTLPGEAISIFDVQFRKLFSKYQFIFLGTTDGYAGYFVDNNDEEDFESEMAEVTVSDVKKHFERIKNMISWMTSTTCGNK